MTTSKRRRAPCRRTEHRGGFLGQLPASVGPRAPATAPSPWGDCWHGHAACRAAWRSCPPPQTLLPWRQGIDAELSARRAQGKPQEARPRERRSRSRGQAPQAPWRSRSGRWSAPPPHQLRQVPPWLLRQGAKLAQHEGSVVRPPGRSRPAGNAARGSSSCCASGARSFRPHRATLPAGRYEVLPPEQEQVPLPYHQPGQAVDPGRRGGEQRAASSDAGASSRAGSAGGRRSLPSLRRHDP